MVIASLVLIFWGSSSDGQSSILNHIIRNYIEETAAFAATAVHSPNQLAEINSLTVTAATPQEAGRGGSQEDLPEFSTVQDNALVAYSPPSKDYIESGGLKRNQVVEYTVQDGDRLSFIASDYGVSVSTIIWANNLRDADSISPGQVLRIPPVSGVVHKVKKGDTVESLAKLYGVEAQSVIAFNDLPLDGDLATGDELIIPDGQPHSSGTKSTSSGTYSNGASVRTAKKFAYLPDLSDYFMIPTTGFNWGILHGRNGIDMANSCGTPIYAAAAGTVTTADGVGYNGGFGKFIKIEHDNGTETLYGHARQLLVSIGETVSRGTLIAYMGTTGRSTGCHLHFEVHGARNPLSKY